MFEDILSRIIATSDPLEPRISLILGAIALVVTWMPIGYRLVRHLVTMIHEAGHALIATLVGRRLSGIRLHSDTSGLTVSKGKPRGLGMIATLLAGYPAPAVVGLGGALLLGLGYAAGMLWALLLVCALMMLLIRNFYGLWVLLATGIGLVALVWWAPEHILVGAAYLIVWALLLAAPRSVVELQRERRRRGGRSSDADQLASLTKIPALFWIAVFWLVCIAALLAGITQLLDIWPLDSLTALTTR